TQPEPVETVDAVRFDGDVHECQPRQEEEAKQRPEEGAEGFVPAVRVDDPPNGTADARTEEHQRREDAAHLPLLPDGTRRSRRRTVRYPRQGGGHRVALKA